MTLNFPSRFIWLVIGAIMLFLLQSGCQPIQPTTPAPSTSAAATSADEGERANLSTSITTASPSPDSNWIATSLLQVPRASETYFQSLIVEHVSGAPIYTIIDDEFPLALGYTVTVPLTWSPDSARFYYTNRPQADGCGLLMNGTDLSSLDLATGEITELLPAHTTTTLALAPDETHVAYLETGAPTLILYNLATGESVTFDLTPMLELDDHEMRPQVGSFVWSPESNRLAFVVAHQPCFAGWATATSIYVLDPATKTAIGHLLADERVLIPVAWADATTLLVENQLPADQKQRHALDLMTNDVTPLDE